MPVDQQTLDAEESSEQTIDESLSEYCEGDPMQIRRRNMHAGHPITWVWTAGNSCNNYMGGSNSDMDGH